MTKKWLQITGGIVGTSLVFITLFANQLGLDNNAEWGVGRFVILLLGIFIFTVSLFYHRNNLIGKALHTYTGRFYLSLGILSIAIIIIYIWIASMGSWATWLNRTSYYDLLATAFSYGQTALEVEPDPRLLSLENLYEPYGRNNTGIPFLWDASLYKGKYYLYWGPAPALLLVPFKLIFTQPIGDKVLTFLFLVGTFTFMTLLILELWKTCFLETPRWAILLGIAFAGLANPLLFVLIRGLVYDAAIISGQFFLIGGLYWLFLAFNRPASKRLFFLAGLFFALAVGSRTTLVLAVAFLSIIVVIWAFKTQRANAFALITTFGLPLLVGAVAYATYNYARFDSIMEFGLRYQLTMFNLHESLDETFSLTYIPPNLYKTLFNPFELHENFPFIYAIRGVAPTWLTGNYPDFYGLFPEDITGILVGSPFILFALFARPNNNIRWIIISLAGSCLLTFFTMQVFFFATMRYLLDLIPALSLLGVIGFWQSLAYLKNHPAAKSVLSVVGIALAIYSIGMSILLAISGDIEAYTAVNPDLLMKLRQFFHMLR